MHRFSIPAGGCPWRNWGGVATRPRSGTPGRGRSPTIPRRSRSPEDSGDDRSHCRFPLSLCTKLGWKRVGSDFLLKSQSLEFYWWKNLNKNKIDRILYIYIFLIENIGPNFFVVLLCILACSLTLSGKKKKGHFPYLMFRYSSTTFKIYLCRAHSYRKADRPEQVPLFSGKKFCFEKQRILSSFFFFALSFSCLSEKQKW